eukprot:jgi/Picsp_1/2393/NSC_05854-R1_---NA---
MFRKIMMQSDYQMYLVKLRGEISVFGRQYTQQLDEVKQKIRGSRSIEIRDCEKSICSLQDRIAECERAVDELFIDSVATKRQSQVCCGMVTRNHAARHEQDDSGVGSKAELGTNPSNPMPNTDDMMTNFSLEMTTDECCDPIPRICSPNLNEFDHVSLNAMQQKYVDSTDISKWCHIETMETAMQEPGSIDQEENTLELRSQIIFNRSNTVHGGRNYPDIDLKDLSRRTEYPSIEDNSMLQSPDELEKAIQLALTQSKARVSPDEVHQARQELSRFSCSASAKKVSNTPSIPESLPTFLPVDETKYATLPSFIRGQLPLELFNRAHRDLYELVSMRSSAGEEMGFNMGDVESATDLPQGKSKVLLNALAKLAQVNLKVIYGRGAVYYFV